MKTREYILSIIACLVFAIGYILYDEGHQKESIQLLISFTGGYVITMVIIAVIIDNKETKQRKARRNKPIEGGFEL